MKKNIIANFFGRFWGILSNFFFIPIYIYFLNFNSYSIISFSLLIMAVMSILDGGITSSLSKEFSRKDISLQERNRVYKTLESVYFIISFISILLIFLLSDYISENWINVKYYKLTEISFFLKIISFEVGFQLLFKFYLGGLFGLEKQIEANLFQVLWGLFRNGLVIVIIAFFPSLKVYFFWQTFTTIFFTLLLKLYLQKKLLGAYISYISPVIEILILKRIWKFTGGVFLISVIAAINTQLDKVLISKLLSLENLGYYTLTITLSQSLLVLINPISTALFPRFSRYYSLEKKVIAKKIYLKAAQLTSILLFSVFSIFTFFAKDLILAWTGNPYIVTNTYFLIPITSFAYSMLALQILPYNIAIANGFTKFNNILGIASLFITIPLYIIGIKNFGTIGAAYTFCIIQFITTLVYLYLINKKFINAKLFKDIYFKQIILPLSISFSITFILSLIPKPFENKFFTISIVLFYGLFVFFSTLLICIPIKKITFMVKNTNLK